MGVAGGAGTGQAGSGVAGTTGGSGGSVSGAGGTSGSAGASGASGTGGSGGNAGATGSAGAGGSGGESGGRGGQGGSSGRGGAGGGTGGAGRGGNAGTSTGGAGGGAAGAGGGAGSSGMSSGCGKAAGIPSSMYNNGTTIPITVNGLQRRFILNVPANYSNTKPYKLIIAWHQRDGNDKQMYANGYYHLLNLSGNNAIFVAPNGEKSNAPCTGNGNGESGCGWPDAGGRNVALGDAVVELIESNFCVDKNRIFATGWSYGGSMSYRTACSRPLGGTTASWGVRAVAAYSGAELSGNCTPSRPVAYYGSHGDNDSVLGYDGGVRLAQNFAAANGCTWATPTKVTSGNHVCTNIAGCTAGYPVTFCSFDGDHTPDPRDPGQSTSWQYQVVWDFFNQF
jgi:poly(3-hydroxybutyrate) depolymerase